MVKRSNMMKRTLEDDSAGKSIVKDGNVVDEELKKVCHSPHCLFSHSILKFTRKDCL